MVQLYHELVPDAILNPNVPHPNIVNGVLSYQGQINGGSAFPLQNQQSTAVAAPVAQPIMQQQPAPTAATMNNSVIEIDD